MVSIRGIEHPLYSTALPRARVFRETVACGNPMSDEEPEFPERAVADGVVARGRVLRNRLRSTSHEARIADANFLGDRSRAIAARLEQAIDAGDADLASFYRHGIELLDRELARTESRLERHFHLDRAAPRLDAIIDRSRSLQARYRHVAFVETHCLGAIVPRATALRRSYRRRLDPLAQVSQGGERRQSAHPQAAMPLLSRAIDRLAYDQLRCFSGELDVIGHIPDR